MLYCETYSGRYFLKNERDLMKSLNDFHKRSLRKEAFTLNDYYRTIGILETLSGEIKICESEEFVDFELVPTEDCCYIYIIPVSPKEEDNQPETIEEWINRIFEFSRV